MAKRRSSPGRSLAKSLTSRKGAKTVKFYPGNGGKNPKVKINRSPGLRRTTRRR